jgi:hypothetical protein
MDDRMFTLTGNDEIHDQLRRQNGRHKVLKRQVRRRDNTTC